jgi:chromosome segregation ATPase
LYDIIEVGRQNPLLDRAVRYFIGDRVVAKNFDQAVKLQKKGIKHIVTMDEGTEFKPGGLISGGNHSNLSLLQLGGAIAGKNGFNAGGAGTLGLDKKIVKLIDLTQKLENSHALLKRTLASDFPNKKA